jgi:hypothetical protein
LERKQRIIAIVVVLVAAAASLADQPAESSIVAPSVSGTAILSPDQPEVRIPFVVEASDDAAAAGDLNLRVVPSVVWEGVDLEFEPRVAGVLVETPRAVFRPQPPYGHYGAVECRNACLGSNELVLRWPAHVKQGHATVDWDISARFVFYVDDPPKGSELTLTADAPPPALDPVAEIGPGS